MSQLQITVPNGWRLVALEEITNKITDGDHQTPERLSSGKTLLSAKNIRDHDIDFINVDYVSKIDFENSRKRCKPETGDVLLTCVGTIGRNTIVGKNSDFMLVRSVSLIKPSEKILAKFLSYYLKSTFVKNSVEKSKKGGGIMSLFLKDIKKIPVLLPPLPIQKKIVEKLDYILNQIDAKKKQILELQEKNEERIKLMRLETSRAILQYFIPMEIPANWHRKKLSELAKVGQGGTPSRANPSYWNGNIPWLRSGEVLDNIIESSREQITEEGFSSKFKNKFPKGTILLAMTGQGRTRGRTALLEIEATANQSCAHIINTSNEILTEFLWEFLKSRYWFIRSIKYGGGQPGINTTLIKELDISYPSKPEQEQILKKIANMGRMIPIWKKHFEEVSDQIDSNVKQLGYIPTQILDKAFSGKLIQ
jgi:type I restriction enzyme S subunit